MKAALAIAWRDVARYFTSPTGYVFITAFIAVGAWAEFWRDEKFFANNLANLAPLSEVFPYILVFFIPLVAMGTWADERRHGTEELLLTLPASDLAIVAGKYLAVLAIYTVALAFSLSHLGMLIWLGSPDGWLMVSTYLGYWLLGASLLALAMVGSFLTESVPVGFILGAVFCAVAVLIGDLEGLARDVAGEEEKAGTLRILLRILFVLLLVGGQAGYVVLARASGARSFGAAVGMAACIGGAVLGLVALGIDLFGLRGLSAASVRPAFRDFTSGVITLGGLTYFGSVGAVGFLVNLFLLRARRMTDGAWHLPPRAVFLAVACGSLCVLTGRLELRADATSERLHTLSKATKDVLADLKAETPVTIQAYVSPKVPQAYVQTRETLLGLLRQFDALGGDRLQVHIRETIKSSDAAREADERYGIKPVQIPETVGGRSARQMVWLACVVTCGTEEVTIPFFWKGLPIEYELTRSVRVVAKGTRLKVGVLSTDAKWFGDFDMQTFSSSPAWEIVEELKKQYEIVQINPPDAPIADKADVLIVPMTSSLTQQQMDHLLAYVKEGRPTLFVDDPLSVMKPGAGANEPKTRPSGGMFPQPGDPKGDIRTFYRELGLLWDPTEVAWDIHNPHPSLQHFDPECVFVTRDNGERAPINDDNPITSGLQEVLMLFPGRTRSAEATGLSFTPLLRGGRNGGVLPYAEVWTRNFFGRGSLNTARKHEPRWNEERVLAAASTGIVKPVKEGQREARVNVVLLCDMDFISPVFFEVRREQWWENIEFDNVTFFLNCVDALAGDSAFIELRKRRPRHRTLEEVEKQTKQHDERVLEEKRKAEREAKDAETAAENRKKEKLDALRERKDIDDQTKGMMLQHLEEVENRRLQVAQQNIKDEKERKIAGSEAERDREVARIHFWIKVVSSVCPPIPAFLVGLAILLRRLLIELEARR
jgi:ABC-2 type transport system permease protein